ncbi:MAG TPA: RNA polymerase sigma factor [Clostridiales bacterium]|nr:RNA polymerase sigma factor [Clostridiales bacterium]HOL90643.1 RNA polymerase sigma factor [Clostridiales bacterium]HPP34844.1 RNA polymerase sigma factor [Clostridiales bacterium]
MEQVELNKMLDNREFLDKLYSFAYVRCSSSHEAEDLCSDILVSIMASAQKSPEIHNLNAFVWTIAHRVYADHCRSRKKERSVQITGNFSDMVFAITDDPIDHVLELVFQPVINYAIEKCIENGLLNIPETSPCAEGTWMVVSK